MTEHRPLARHRYRSLSIASVLTLLLLWWLIAWLGLVSSLFLPSPGEVLQAFSRLYRQGYMDTNLGQHIYSSLSRIFIALLATIVSSSLLGIAMGLSAWLRALIDPWVEFLRPLPPLAYLPLIVIWCGIGEDSKILLIYLSMFAPMLIATVQGVSRVDPSRLQAVRSLGANRWQLIRLVVLPSALPDMLTGLRIAMGVGWSCLVAAELIATSRGLGFMVQSAAQFLATDIVIAGILIIAALALSCELALRWLQRRFASWH